MNIEIPNELGAALTEIAHRLRKKEKDLLLQALTDYLEDQEDCLDGIEAYQRWIKSGKETVSFEDVLKKCEIDEDDLDT